MLQTQIDRFIVVEPIHRSQVLDLTLVLTISYFYFRFFDDVRLVRGCVLVDYEDVCDDFVNFKMLCDYSSIP